MLQAKMQVSRMRRPSHGDALRRTAGQQAGSGQPLRAAAASNSGWAGRPGPHGCNCGGSGCHAATTPPHHTPGALVDPEAAGVLAAVQAAGLLPPASLPPARRSARARGRAAPGGGGRSFRWVAAAAQPISDRPEWFAGHDAPSTQQAGGVAAARVPFHFHVPHLLGAPSSSPDLRPRPLSVSNDGPGWPQQDASTIGAHGGGMEVERCWSSRGKAKQARGESSELSSSRWVEKTAAHGGKEGGKGWLLLSQCGTGVGAG